MQQPDSLHEFQSQVSLFKPIFEAEETSSNQVYLISFASFRIPGYFNHGIQAIQMANGIVQWIASRMPQALSSAEEFCGFTAITIRNGLKMQEELITANYRLSCLKCSNSSFRIFQKWSELSNATRLDLLAQLLLKLTSKTRLRLEKPGLERSWYVSNLCPICSNYIIYIYLMIQLKDSKRRITSWPCCCFLVNNEKICCQTLWERIWLATSDA